MSAPTVKFYDDLREKAAPLFAGWDETLITSCLQGIMGQIYVREKCGGLPESAAAVLGDFCFLAGKPDRELAVHDFDRDFLIMVPQNEAWSEVIEEVWGERAFRRMRYAIKKDPSCFDQEKLLEYVKKLPEPYQLHPIDKELYRQCREQDWSRDLVALFSTFEMYEQLGLGMVVTKDGEIVSGASSYSRYREGIEIEIDTSKAHRRRSSTDPEMP